MRFQDLQYTTFGRVIEILFNAVQSVIVIKSVYNFIALKIDFIPLFTIAIILVVGVQEIVTAFKKKEDKLGKISERNFVISFYFTINFMQSVKNMPMFPSACL